MTEDGNRPAVAGNAGRTGVVPHVTRVLGRTLSPHGARGAWREAFGLLTHLALYPLGMRAASIGPVASDHSDTFDLPVVVVHGYFHNRSGFFFLARALRKCGFRWVYGMNYNPLGETIPSLAARLASHVEEVMRATGAPRVHIVGHSLGGLIARWYVQEMHGWINVDHVVTIGTPHAGTYVAYLGPGEAARQMRPGSSVLRRLQDGFARCPARFLNLYSDLDVLLVPPSTAVLPERPNVHNHLIHDLGHTSLLISPELISVISDHLAQAVVRAPMAEIRSLPRSRPTERAAEQ